MMTEEALKLVAEQANYLTIITGLLFLILIFLGSIFAYCLNKNLKSNDIDNPWAGFMILIAFISIFPILGFVFNLKDTIKAHISPEVYYIEELKR